MTTTETNLAMLRCWQLAYRLAGEAALPAFGLSEADIDAVLTVDEATKRLWAELPTSLVAPRPGLLTALRAGDRLGVEAHRGRAASITGPPRLERLPRVANTHLISAWAQAATNLGGSRMFDLAAEDVAALRGTSNTALRAWSELPIALATPKPGLLPGLFAQAEPRVTAFLDGLTRAAG